MLLRAGRLGALTIILLILTVRLHAATAEKLTLKKCMTSITQFAKLNFGKPSEPKRVVTDLPFDLETAQRRAIENYLRREKPVTSTQGTLGTQRYRLSEETKITSIDSIDGLRNIPGVLPNAHSGKGFKEALQGELNGQHVFIKVSWAPTMGKLKGAPRDIKDFTNEVAWVKQLDAMGIGPKFHGITERDGFRGIVTEFVEGTEIGLLPTPEKIPADLRATPALIASLERIAKVIEREGFFADNLQIRVNSNGAYVVDPEFFRPATNVGEIENATGKIQDLMTELKSRIVD
jgi:hypothetical protein